MIDRDHPVRRLARKATEKLKETAAQLKFELVRFRTGKADIDFNIDLTQETVWATQQQIADLFGKDREAIGNYISQIYDERELNRVATTTRLPVNETDSGRLVEHYNLDVILSVGYRVSSQQATKFRQWATRTLRTYVDEGFVLNEARLRDDPDALRKLAAILRQRRASEKNKFAAVRECFKVSAIDYDKDAKVTRTFYSILQDKLHYAVTQQTASEIVLDRANHKQRHMGLRTMKGGSPTLADATVGKNYLDPDELYILYILCEQFLLYAESKSLRGQTMTMKELSAKFDALLATNDYPIFREYKGYRKDQALQHAQTELALYKRRLVRERAVSALSSPA